MIDLIYYWTGIELWSHDTSKVLNEMFREEL